MSDYKLKVGDRVQIVHLDKIDDGEIDHLVNSYSGARADIGMTGTVDEDECINPYVIWDKPLIRNDKRWCTHQDRLERIGEKFQELKPKQMIFHHSGEWEPPQIKKQSLIEKTMNFIKNATLSKADKTLIKAGFMSEDMELTGQGIDALQFIQYKSVKDELVQMAEEQIKEDEEK